MVALVACLAMQKSEKPAFEFLGSSYVHRYSKDDLHEFTPKGQSDLSLWKDMVTRNDYKKAKSGEDLAGIANSVLETYAQNGGKILRTNSVPRTSKIEAEHLIVVRFATDRFTETAFARFLMSGGTGHSVVYSHRIYGTGSATNMDKWLSKSGASVEKALMALPKLPEPK